MSRAVKLFSCNVDLQRAIHCKHILARSVPFEPWSLHIQKAFKSTGRNSKGPAPTSKRAQALADLQPTPDCPLSFRSLKILRANQADIAGMAEIERLTHGFWNEQDFSAELRNDHAVLLTAQCTLAEKELLVGLVLMWCLVDEAQIIELAVHPDFRRQGIGLSLMSEAMAEGIRRIKKKFGRGAAILEVSRDNLPAIALYRKLGFQESGLRKAYYPDGSDAYTMRLRIN